MENIEVRLGLFVVSVSPASAGGVKTLDLLSYPVSSIKLTREWCGYSDYLLRVVRLHNVNNEACLSYQSLAIDDDELLNIEMINASQVIEDDPLPMISELVSKNDPHLSFSDFLDFALRCPDLKSEIATTDQLLAIECLQHIQSQIVDGLKLSMHPSTTTLELLYEAQKDVLSAFSIKTHHTPFNHSNLYGKIPWSTLGGKPKAVERKHIYIIGCKKLRTIKIGISSNPKSRLASLQTNCPYKLELLFVSEAKENARDIERDLHHRLSLYRLHGEWFSESAYDQIDLVKFRAK